MGGIYAARRQLDVGWRDRRSQKAGKKMPPVGGFLLGG
jgi:hypothetical protein